MNARLKGLAYSSSFAFVPVGVFYTLAHFTKTFVCSFVVLLTALLFHSPGSCHSEKVTLLLLEGKLTRTGLTEN